MRGRLLAPILLLAGCAMPGGVSRDQRAPSSKAPDLAEKWQVHAERHWQRRNDLVEANRGRGIVSPRSDPRCGLPGMARVEGRMLQGPVEWLQDKACEQWISRNFPARCARYNMAKWLRHSKRLQRKDLAFCIDRFEYPNVPGQNPVIMMSFYESEKLCAVQGKRLCTDEEWTFACEGEEGLPYPYGYERSSQKCNIDRPWIRWDENKWYGIKHMKRSSPEIAAELERLWQGVPSGSMPGCVSPFGVYDMTGNVDEWTVNKISGGGHKGAYKGGYWSTVRDRCRPATIKHAEGDFFYQQGTRCCSDR